MIRKITFALYLITVTFFFIKSVSAQDFPNLQFSEMNTSGQMIKGDDGFLYIVANGKVCIWDGFKANPLPMPQTKETADLGADKIILKDNLIFIGYTDALSVYNKTTKQYIFYNQNATDKRYLTKNNSGAEFFKDHSGQVYVKAGALYKVNADLSLSEYTELSQQLKSKNLLLDQIPYEDRDNNLWLACKDSKLVKLTKDKTIERYYNLLQLNQTSYRFYQDTKGRYWLYCWYAGLQLFDTKTGESHIVNQLLSEIVIKDMCEWKDNNGNNWIVCATDRGIRLLNFNTFEVKCFNRDNTTKIAKAKNKGEPTKLLVDDENILWIYNEGSNNEYIAPARQRFNNFSLTTNYHFAKAPYAPRANGDDYVIPNRISTPDSNIWIGALFGKGVSVFTKKMQFVTNYPNYTKTAGDVENAFANFNYIKAIDENNYVVTTTGYVVAWDKKNKLSFFKDELSLNEKGKYKGPNFTAIYPYNTHQYIIKANEYFYLFDYNNKKLTRWFSLKDSSVVTVSPKQTRHLQFTKTGLWILYETALLQYDTGLHKITQLYSFEKKGKYYFPESNAVKFTEDENGNLWIAGSTSLLQLNTKTGVIKDFKNVPNLNAGFNNIAIDKKQKIWLLAGSNIICYNYKDNTTQTFSGNGALSGAAGYGLWIDGINNNIWIGAEKYLTVFNTYSVLKKPLFHKIIVTQILQGDSAINFNANKSQYFVLPYDKSTITLHAAFTSFNKINEPLIAFKLRDEEEWKYSTTGDITFYNLGPGKYNLQIAEAFYQNEIIDNSIINVPFKISPPFYTTAGFMALMFSLVFIVGYFLNNYRLYTARVIANENEKSAQLLQVKTELEKKLSESEMAALQSQMNPHFIFNVLNSINKYILTSNINKASEYLVGFSKLIRMVLENSKQSKVSLQSDLEALQLYINMEKMRFEDKFESTIEIDNNVDTQFIMIPPLIIQPYVENAIWHGLLQKDGDNKLTINIAQPDKNILLITISDDGVGRRKAMELRSKSASQKKSFGMQITKDRISIVNKLFNMENSVQIEDLYNEVNQPIGTKVTLRLLV